MHLASGFLSLQRASWLPPRPPATAHDFDSLRHVGHPGWATIAFRATIYIIARRLFRPPSTPPLFTLPFTRHHTTFRTWLISRSHVGNVCRRLCVPPAQVGLSSPVSAHFRSLLRPPLWQRSAFVLSSTRFMAWRALHGSHHSLLPPHMTLTRSSCWVSVVSRCRAQLRQFHLRLCLRSFLFCRVRHDGNAALSFYLQRASWLALHGSHHSLLLPHMTLTARHVENPWSAIVALS